MFTALRSPAVAPEWPQAVTLCTVRKALGSLAIAGLFAAILSGGALPARGQEKSAPEPTARSPHEEKEKSPDGKPLFDGKTLEGWRVTDFGGRGTTTVEDGAIILGMGSPMTGITYERDFPKCDYEIELDARRLEGTDFFCALTFPVQDSFCTLVVGGWGGTVVGISRIDHADAAENQTTRSMKFNKDQWYHLRVAVRRDRLRAWIDDKRIVDVDVTDRELDTRLEVRRSQPLGIATYETRGAVRHIQYRALPPAGQQPQGETKDSAQGNPGSR